MFSHRFAPRRRLVALAVSGVLVAGCGVARDDPIVVLSAEPVPGTSSFPPPSANPSDDPSESVEPSESVSETKRPPTDADRGRFIATFRPAGATDLEHVSRDTDADGIDEIVFAYVDTNEQRVTVAAAWWDGSEVYAVAAELVGTQADRIDRLRVGDANADGLIEIITFQSGPGDAASLTVWQVTGPGMIRPVRAVGGCHGGSATFGAVGATMNDRDGDGSDEIYATCDDSPLPRSAWSTDRYIWRQGAYRHAPSVVG